MRPELEVGKEVAAYIDDVNGVKKGVTFGINERKEETSSLRHRSSSGRKADSSSVSDDDVGLSDAEGLRGQLRSSRSLFFSEERLMANDTYTMMMMAESMNTEEWLLGGAVWIIQGMLMSFILYEWHMVDGGPPLRVVWYVAFTQFTTCVLVVMMQTDVSRAIQNIIIMMHAPERKWMKTLPSCMKLVEGLLTIIVSFLTIVRSESVRGLIEGFVAIIIVSEFDDAFYNVAKNGFFNMNLAKRAKDATDVPLRVLAGDILQDKRFKARVHYITKCSILIITFVILFFWTFILNRQCTGYYAKQNLPKCFTEQLDRDPTHLSNRQCEQYYNTAFCNFDGGDCMETNQRYPNCRADFPYKIGNGHCDFELNDERCGFDGGDCITIDEQRNDWVEDGRCKMLMHECENLSTSQNDTVADVLWCNCTSIESTNLMRRYVLEEVKGFAMTPFLYKEDGDDDAKAFFFNQSGYGNIMDFRNRSGYGDTTDLHIGNGKLPIIPIAADFSSTEESIRIIGNPNHNNNTGMVTFIGNQTDPFVVYGNEIGSRFGNSVAITDDGSTIFVGATGNLSTKSNGRVIKYVLQNNTYYSEVHGEDDFGYGHSISTSGDGNSLIIGAPYEGNGRVYIYNNLTKNKKIYDRFDGDQKQDLFGGSVSMSNDGSVCAVGALAVAADGIVYSDIGGEYVKLYKYDEREEKYVQFSETITIDVVSSFGFSVSLSEDGKWLAVGAPRHDNRGNSNNEGKAYLYKIGNYRVSLVSVLEGSAEEDWFGFWVRVYEKGSYLAVGAPAPMVNVNSKGEYVRIYNVPSSSGALGDL